MSTPKIDWEAHLPEWLQRFRIEQALDRDGTGSKILVPQRAMVGNRREMPDQDMPPGFWAQLVWNMMSYKECGLKTAKIEVYRAVTGEDPPEHLEPWNWLDEGFWRTDE